MRSDGQDSGSKKEYALLEGCGKELIVDFLIPPLYIHALKS
jgi:hypothetical protein